jgi:DNA polymerase III gamma/tau subunit
MKRGWIVAVCLTAMLLGLARTSEAQQRGGRRANPMVQTPYESFQNPTMTPEWRRAGGNPMVYQQMMRQKMAGLQRQNMQKAYQEMRKQQAAFQKWYAEQKALKDKGKPTDPMFDRLQAEKEAEEAAVNKALEKRQAAIQAKKDKEQRRKQIIQDHAKGKTSSSKPTTPAADPVANDPPKGDGH